MPTRGVWRQASTSRAAGVWLQAVIAPRMCGNTAKTMCCRWCVQDASCVSTAHVSKRVPFTPVCCHIQKSVSTHAHVDLKGRVSTKGLCLQDEPRCVELHILGSRRGDNATSLSVCSPKLPPTPPLGRRALGRRGWQLPQRNNRQP